MLVEELMTTDIVTCEYDDTLQTAVVTLLRENVGSVIVIRNGEPTGILTETDSLLAGAKLERAFTDIPVRKVFSQPLITTTRDTTVRKAVRTMKSNDIKKLPVVDGIDLEGIITVTDIGVNTSEIIQETREMAEQRERWEARMADIDEF